MDRAGGYSDYQPGCGPASYGGTLAAMMPSPEAAAALLAQALPYIQNFHNQTFVIKYGGASMANTEGIAGVVRNVLLLQSVGIRPILVHGGGPEIDKWLQRLDIPKKVLNGLRVTDDDTMEVVEMVLSGRSNKSLVAHISREGGKAIGLSGRDGNLLIAEAVSEELGRVGNVIRVNPELLELATANGYIPVVASVAEDVHGEPLNVNADSAAAAVAGAVGASKLILLTDTDGVLRDKNDKNSTISELSTVEAEEMIASGAADRGMIPKLRAALDALDDGVHSVHLLNGAFPNALLVEVLTERGLGTMITR